MADQPLFFLDRLQAAWCYLVGLIWLPIAFIVFSIVPIFTQSLTFLTISLFYFSTIAMLLGSLLTLSAWVDSRGSHPFVDRSGRCAINLMLSHSLYLLIVSTLVSTHYDSSIKAVANLVALSIYPLVPIISLPNTATLWTIARKLDLSIDLIALPGRIFAPSGAVYLVLGGLLGLVFGVVWMLGIFSIAVTGFPVLFVLTISISISLILQIIGAISAIFGDVYSYPLTIKFIPETPIDLIVATKST